MGNLLLHHHRNRRAGQQSSWLPSTHEEPFLEWPGPGNFTSPKPLGADPFGEFETYEIHTHEIHPYEMHHRHSFLGALRFKGAHLSLQKAHAEGTPLSEAKKDDAIEKLSLSDVAKKAAYELKRQHPSVVFTSGLRNREDQARAMASNVAGAPRAPHWIKDTYKHSAARDACQKWVDHHPLATEEETSAGLKSVLDSFSDAQLGGLSRHLSGNAFDVKPVKDGGAEIKKTMRSMADEAKKKGDNHAWFTDKEGGKVRWHIQF